MHTPLSGVCTGLLWSHQWVSPLCLVNPISCHYIPLITILICHHCGTDPATGDEVIIDRGHACVSAIRFHLIMSETSCSPIMLLCSSGGQELVYVCLRVWFSFWYSTFKAPILVSQYFLRCVCLTYRLLWRRCSLPLLNHRASVCVQYTHVSFFHFVVLELCFQVSMLSKAESECFYTTLSSRNGAQLLLHWNRKYPWKDTQYHSDRIFSNIMREHFNHICKVAKCSLITLCGNG